MDDVGIAHHPGQAPVSVAGIGEAEVEDGLSFGGKEPVAFGDDFLGLVLRRCGAFAPAQELRVG